MRLHNLVTTAVRTYGVLPEARKYHEVVWLYALLVLHTQDNTDFHGFTDLHPALLSCSRRVTGERKWLTESRPCPQHLQPALEDMYSMYEH